MLKNTLKELRIERNLKQEDIAKIIGISASAYGYYEQGKTTPDPETIITLSKFYDVSTDYLLGLSSLRNYPETFEDHADDEMPEEALQELENFKEYLKNKYSKKGQD